MALTLLEAAKLIQDPLKQAVVSEFSEGQIMGTVPFENEEGTGVHYNKTQALPGVGFRGYNESFTESTGVLNNESEAFRLFGGDLDVDTALVAMKGASVRSTHEQLKVQALRMAWEYQFIKGTSVDGRGFDGLQSRVTGSQIISNAAAGGAGSLAKLDQAISQVEKPTALIMSRKVKDLMSAAGRNSTLNNLLSSAEDRFGRKLTHYGELPILVDSLSNPILPFTEAAPDGSGSTFTSIYIVSFGAMSVTGIQGRNPSGGFGIDVRDLGEIDNPSVYRTRIDWNCAFAVYSGFAVSRLAGIANTAFVA